MVDQQNNQNNFNSSPTNMADNASRGVGGREQFISQEGGQGVPIKLLLFSLGLFLFVFLVYLGLSMGYGGYLNSQIDDIDSQIDELAFRVSPEEQTELSLFYTRIANVDHLLSNRLLSNRLFDFIENSVHPGIHYSSIQFNSDNGTLEMVGNAESLRSLAEQLLVFEESGNISNILVANIQNLGSIISFEASMNVSRLISANNSQ